MKIAEIIERFGEDAYEEHLAQCNAYNKVHKVKANARAKKYHEEHPEGEKAKSQEACRKGGRHYEKHLAYMQTGIPEERHKIREKHGAQWRSYKNIIAPDSQIHHQWIPETANYEGVALVEADAHMHGVIDVIKILEGKITLLTEKEVMEDGI